MTSALLGLELQSPGRFVFGFGAWTGAKALAVTKQSMVGRGDVAPDHPRRRYGLQRDQLGVVADLSWGQIDGLPESNPRPFGRRDAKHCLDDAT